MKISKDDVKKAIDSLHNHLPSDDVNKGENGDKDLNSANGAATGGGDGSLEAPGEDMNDKSGNKKGKGMKTDTSKSMPSNFGQDLPPEIETKVEVSEFLKSLVDHNAQRFDQLRDYVVKSGMASEDRLEEFSEQIGEIQKSMGDLGIVLKAICERIGILENQPGVAKSVTAEGQTVSKSEVVDRNFSGADQGDAGNTEGQETGMFKSLTGQPPHVQKSMISSALCDLVKKGEAADLDVINFESHNYLAPEVYTKLQAVL